MVLYSSIFALLVILMFHYDFNRKHQRGATFWYWTICIILICIAGLRYRVGGDTLSYFDHYADWPAFSDFAQTDFSLLRYQPLFYVLPAFCKLFSPEFYVFQFLEAAIVVTVAFWFLKKHVQYHFFAILLWYCFAYCYFTMEIMREAVCVSILLVATRPMLQHRYIIYYCLATVAFFIHASSILLFVLPIACRIGAMQTWKLFAIGAIFIGGIYIVLRDPYVFLDIVPVKVLSLGVYYYEHGVYFPTFIKSTLHAIALLLAMQTYKKFYPEHTELLPLVKFCIILYFSTGLIYMAERLTNYFIVFEIVILTQICRVVSCRQYLRVYQVSAMKIMAAYMLLLVLKTDYYIKDQSHYAPGQRFYNRFVPYETIFTPRSHPDREAIVYNARLNGGL